MRELVVQIENLEPMRVAAVAVKSESPETDAINLLLDWARPQGLLDGAFRLFGYDNCQPHPNHIYTTWLTVGPEVAASRAVEIKDFPGGLFATTEIQGVEQISPAWQQLAQWGKDKECGYGGHPGLEEHLDLLSDRLPDELRFKLYLSIRA